MLPNKTMKSVALLCAVILLFSLCTASCKEAPQEETATRTFYGMSTFVLLQIKAAGAEQICDEMQAAVLEFEQAASMFIEGSEVWRVNDAAGKEAVRVSGDVYDVIERAAESGWQSDGLFDATIGPLSRLWDVMSPEPVVPDQRDIDEALALVDYNDILLQGDNRVMLARPGQMIDLGGIAKGYALDICRRVLDRHEVSQGLISIGGNVMAYKDKGGTHFTVGIRYPEAGKESEFCALRVTDTVVSTTGGYERFFEQDGVVYHHVIDPRTGRPVQGDLLSVSVVLPDGLTADYMSTRMFVGGLAYCLDLMRNEGVQAVVVDRDNKAYVSESLRDSMVDELSDTQTYEFIYV